MPLELRRIGINNISICCRIVFKLESNDFVAFSPRSASLGFLRNRKTQDLRPRRVQRKYASVKLNTTATTVEDGYTISGCRSMSVDVDGMF